MKVTLSFAQYLSIIHTEPRGTITDKRTELLEQYGLVHCSGVTYRVTDLKKYLLFQMSHPQ